MATYSELMTIASNSAFQSRIRYALTKSSLDVIAEDPGTADHGARRAYAVSILRGASDLTSASASVLSNPTIAAGADPEEPDFGVSDSDLQFAINSVYSALAAV